MKDRGNVVGKYGRDWLMPRIAKPEQSWSGVGYNGGSERRHRLGVSYYDQLGCDGAFGEASRMIVENKNRGNQATTVSEGYSDSDSIGLQID